MDTAADQVLAESIGSVVLKVVLATAGSDPGVRGAAGAAGG